MARKFSGLLVGAGLLIVLGILVFKLFEPVFVWNLGWRALPEGPYPVSSEAAPGAQDLGEAADAWLASARAALDAPSLSAAVSVDGVTVWAGAAGYADLDKRLEATPETAFRIGSTSKAVTSVAMGTLIDKRAVDLDAPVSHYLSGLAAPLATVTTRQAMSHTAGVRNYGACLCFPVWEHLNRKHYDGSQAETLRGFASSPLLFEPGTGFAYTSLGYNAAGAVIEAASDAPFADYLEKTLFEPLGMARSFAETGADIPNQAAFYEVERGRYKQAFRVDNSNKLPSGGLVSTPSDLMALGGQMIAPTLFGAATRDLLMTPQELADGSDNPQGYALGWRYNPEAEYAGGMKTSRLSHHGTAQGSTSYFAVLPEKRMVVSVMMNNGATGVEALGAEAEKLTLLFASQGGDEEAAGTQ